jgi:hypothetical protein
MQSIAEQLTAKKISLLIIALTAWFALILQLYIMLEKAPSIEFTAANTIINFFSFFTVLSNLLVAIIVTFTLFSPSSLAGRFCSSLSVQSAIALYIFIVGLVYNLILRSLWAPTGWQLVADNLLHVIVPLLYVLYWVSFTPKRKLQWKNILPWLIFPAIYLIYSLIRGTVAGWYPYPFLDAAKLGYGKVAINSFFVLTAFVVVSLELIAVNRIGKKRPNNRLS